MEGRKEGKASSEHCTVCFVVVVVIQFDQPTSCSSTSANSGLPPFLYSSTESCLLLSAFCTTVIKFSGGFSDFSAYETSEIKLLTTFSFIFSLFRMADFKSSLSLSLRALFRWSAAGLVVVA